MSDQFDVWFEGLRGQRPPAPFAPPEAVRRRGRQRAHRQAVSAGVAVLAVTGLGAGGAVTLLDRPGPEPALPPAATATAVPTRIAGDWLLTVGDLAGTGWEPTGNELIEGEWYWDGAQPWCPEFRIADYPSVRQRRDLRAASWTRPGEALPERVDEVVELFEPGVGTGNLADVRRYVETCSRRPAPADEVAPTYYRIEATGIAGDESLLLRVEQYMFDQDDEIVRAGEFHHVAVVRVGDAVATIIYRAGGDVREVAQRAAGRLG